MWGTYVLITLTVCLENSFSSDVDHTSASEFQQDITMNGVGRSNLPVTPSIAEIGDSFRRQLSQLIIPIDSRNASDEISALLSVSNMSLEDYRGGNLTNLNFLELREIRKQQRLQLIKDSVLQLTGRAKESNASFVQSEKSSSMLNDSLKNENSQEGISRTSRESELRIEVQPSLRILSSGDIDESVFSSEMEEWLSYYCYNNSAAATRSKRIRFQFSDFGLDGIVVAPNSFDWIVCSRNSSVRAEVYNKLSTESYPSAIRRHASRTLQRMTEKELRTDNDCTPGGWVNLAVMYSKGNASKPAMLDDFLPTYCNCKYYP